MYTLLYILCMKVVSLSQIHSRQHTIHYPSSVSQIHHHFVILCCPCTHALSEDANTAVYIYICTPVQGDRERGQSEMGTHYLQSKNGVYFM